ncbi:MAG: tyrosine-type recombinase/integrase [Bacteroidota bacterium]
MPDPGPPLKLSVAQLDDRLDLFANEYLRTKSKETVGTYRRALNEFERWFATQKGTFLFRAADVERYKDYLMNTRGLHQVSVSTYLTALRRFCQYLVDVGMLAENPARGVKGNRRPTSHSRQVLTEADIEALLGVISTADQIGKRDAAIVHAMLYAGLSEIEIVRADVEDLEQTLLGWHLRVQGKGRTVKDQQVPVDPIVMEKVRIYLDARGRIRPTDPLFVSHGHRSDGERLNTRSVRSRINRHLTAAKVKRPGVTPHSLTHTAALIWLNDGMPLEEVKQRMRHGTLETTMISFRRQGLLKVGSGNEENKIGE